MRNFCIYTIAEKNCQRKLSNYQQTVKKKTNKKKTKLSALRGNLFDYLRIQLLSGIAAAHLAKRVKVTAQVSACHILNASVVNLLLATFVIFVYLHEVRGGPITHTQSQKCIYFYVQRMQRSIGLGFAMQSSTLAV